MLRSNSKVSRDSGGCPVPNAREARSERQTPKGKNCVLIEQAGQRGSGGVLQGEGNCQSTWRFCPRRQAGEWGIVSLAKDESHTFSPFFQ